MAGNFKRENNNFATFSHRARPTLVLLAHAAGRQAPPTTPGGNTRRVFHTNDGIKEGSKRQGEAICVCR
eukprot:scaffold37999_cov214-Skeletonema_marinoi.AAC.15